VANHLVNPSKQDQFIGHSIPNFREPVRTALSTLLYAYRKERWWIGFERAFSELRICQDRGVNILSLIRRASRECCVPGHRSLHSACCFTRSWTTGQVFAAVSRSNRTRTAHVDIDGKLSV